MSTKPLTRYSPASHGADAFDAELFMEEDKSGSYVHVEDHEAAVKALEDEIALLKIQLAEALGHRDPLY